MLSLWRWAQYVCLGVVLLSVRLSGPGILVLTGLLVTIVGREAVQWLYGGSLYSGSELSAELLAMDEVSRPGSGTSSSGLGSVPGIIRRRRTSELWKSSDEPVGARLSRQTGGTKGSSGSHCGILST